MRGWVRCAPAFSERRERLAENRVCSRLHSPQRLRAVAAVSANHVFAAQKWFDYPTRPKQKKTIGKRSFIKRIRARVGTVRSRIFRTLRAFSGKSRVLPTTQSAAAVRRCGCFGEPCFCCAKMVRLSTRPKQKQTIKKMVCFCLVGEGGFGPPKLKSNRFTVCPLWPLGNSPIMELVMGLEPATC